jgi:hypothetical protein
MFGFRVSHPNVTRSEAGAYEGDISAFCRQVCLGDSILCSVWSTYTIDMDFALSRYPFIFSAAPALILHGDKSANKRQLNELISNRYLTHSIRVHEVTPSTNRKRQRSGRFRSGGVHHPKYILLFFATKVVAVVTTSNLVHQSSVDTWWSQEFPRAASQSAVPGSFGSIFADFIEAVSS